MEKLMFAKLLGELYRTQKRIDPTLCTASDATIYGLLNGFQPVIDRELIEMGWITQDEITAVCDVLQPYLDDEEKLNSLTGYYRVEPALNNARIDRNTVITILTYLKASGRYGNVMEKFDFDGSPVESRLG